MMVIHVPLHTSTITCVYIDPDKVSIATQSAVKNNEESEEVDAVLVIRMLPKSTDEELGARVMKASRSFGKFGVPRPKHETLGFAGRY